MMDGNLMLLLAWGMAVGVDLIAGPQVMISRPIVAATVAGLISGDVVTGASVGLLFELFAWEVMPFGAARYPDYGVGAIVAAVTAAHAPGVFGIGIAVGVGLVTAQLGELTIRAVRRWNSVDLERHADDLDEGEYSAARNLHLRGLLRELGRALLLVSVGLLLSQAVLNVIAPGVETAVAATVVAAGTGIGTAFASGMRMSASRLKQAWYVAGLMAGIVWVIVA